MSFQLIALDRGRFEEHRVIQKAYIHTTAIRAFQQNRFQTTTVFAVRLGTQVIQTTNILHLGYTDTCSAARIIIRTELCYSITHPFDLVLVLHRCPFHTTVRQVLVVILTLVMNRVEEVLQIVESNTANILTFAQVLVRSLFLVSRAHRSAERQQQCRYPKKCMFHNI